MAYADLTTEQKATLDDWTNQTRAILGEFAKVCNHADAINIVYNGSIAAILAELSESDVVDNKSGLAGAQSMTKDEIVTCISYIQGFLQYNTDAHRGNIAKACGLVNLIG